MSISSKLLVVFALVLGGMCVAVHMLHRNIIFTKFVELEHREATTNAERALAAINAEMERLSAACGDYADWDATREHMANPTEKYRKENLSTNMPLAKINFIGITKADGQVFDSNCLDLAWEEAPALKDEILGILRDRDTLIQKDVGQIKHDFILTSKGPLLIVSRHIPVVTKSEKPMGSYFMGRFLSEEVVQELAVQARVDLTMTVNTSSTAPSQAAVPAQMVTPIALHTSKDSVLADAHILDRRGQTVLDVTVKTPRKISAEGLSAVRKTTLFVFAGCAIALTGLLLFARKAIVRDIETLARHATEVGETGDLDRSTNLTGRRDEIGSLAKEFERMAGRLKESQQKLSDTARAAGMAQIAAGALHNVGNVLNSINTAASTIGEQLKQTKSGNLARINAMLKENEPKLGDFFQNDPKGKKVLPYLSELSDQLTAEQKRSNQTLDRLFDELHHAIEIVRSQQVYAKTVNLNEKFNLKDVLTKAIRITQPSLDRHEVKLAADLSEELVINTDRIKLTQILVNLLTNAKEAVKRLDPGTGRITVHAEMVGEAVRIEVVDNGVGISAQNLKRVFTQGFTTREDGNGLGLPFCVMTAQELSGTIRVESEGEGKGARFILELPQKAAELAKAA